MIVFRGLDIHTSIYIYMYRHKYISRYRHICRYIQFASWYPTSPSMTTVLYEIACPIARSLAAPGGRKKKLEESEWKGKGFDRWKSRSLGRSFDRSVAQSFGRSVDRSLPGCVLVVSRLVLCMIQIGRRLASVASCSALAPIVDCLSGVASCSGCDSDAMRVAPRQHSTHCVFCLCNRVSFVSSRCLW